LSVVLAAASAVVAAGAARADPNFTIGAGGAYVMDYEGSNDYEPVPVWNLRVGNLYDPNTYISVRGLRLESNLLPSENFRLGPVARYLPDYDHVDDDAVEDLERPATAVHAGLLAGYEFTDERHIRYGIELEATYDVLHGNGAIVTPRAKIRLPLAQNTFLSASIGASWASADYMSNRFGISDADAARSGLQPFDADAGFKDAGIDLGLTYAFDKHWSLTTGGSYQHMLGDAADSPIVDERGDDDGFRASAVVNYRF
jgi:outer membrane protein